MPTAISNFKIYEFSQPKYCFLSADLRFKGDFVSCKEQRIHVFHLTASNQRQTFLIKVLRVNLAFL